MTKKILKQLNEIIGATRDMGGCTSLGCHSCIIHKTYFKLGGGKVAFCSLEIRKKIALQIKTEYILSKL